MKGNFFHLLRIARVLVHHNLDEFLTAIHLFRPYAFLFRLVPKSWRREAGLPRGVRLREALQDLGPVFVKFGQILSTRPDLLPDDISRELVKLQDEVPPFPGVESREIIETAYGEPLDKHFKTFETEPVASASVAQVHNATLYDDTEVVVKVLRPGIASVIERDLKLLYTLAGLADRYLPDAKRLRPLEVVEEYDKTIHDELDMMREAANASQLRANFLNSDLIYVPEVYWDHTRRNVMVMERIGGIPIRDVAAIKAAGIDMRKLAYDGVEIFFTQAFRDGFFHADMHPGNIFVAENGQYRAVDFGIMGTLSDADKRYLAENFLAFFHRDYHAVADAHLRAGWVPPDTRAEEFEAAIRTVCEPVFARPISEISFGHFLLDLFRTARRFDMPIQPQLVLLQKTLLNIEGLGRQLYPELDLWDTAKPFLERWMREQIGPRAALRSLKRELPKLATLTPEIPNLIHGLLRRLQDEELVLRTRSEGIDDLRRELRRSQRRLFGATLGGMLLLSGLVYAALGGAQVASLSDLPWPSWLLAATGLGVILGGWYSSRD